MFEKATEMAEVFKALADPTRLRIIRMLASKMEEKICVADLAARLNMTQPAVSQHIKVLKNVGILEPQREGYHTFYQINVEVLRQYKLRIDELFGMAFVKYSPCASPNDCFFGNDISGKDE